MVIPVAIRAAAVGEAEPTPLGTSGRLSHLAAKPAGAYVIKDGEVSEAGVDRTRS